MTTQKTNQSLIQVLTEGIRNIAGTIGILSGIGYIAGYLVVNFYLTQYGVATLNLVQSRYFAAGALFLIISALVCGAPLVSLYTAEQLSKAGNRIPARRMILLIAASLLLAAFICWTGGIILVSADRFTPFAKSIIEREKTIWLGLPASEIAILFPFFLYYMTRRAFRNRPPAKTGLESTWSSVTFSGLFIICLLISTVVFSRFVYPNTSPSLGGGAPIKVQLVVSGNLSNIQDFPLKINNSITEEVILIDHSGSEFVVLHPQTNQVIEISDGQVLSILH